MSSPPRPPSRSPSRSTRSGLDLLPLTQAPSFPPILHGGYIYQDPGSAPDDRATGQPIRRAGTTLSQEREIYTRQSPSQRLQDLSLRIHKRDIDGGWRAQIFEAQPQPPPGQHQETSFTETEILRNWSRQDVAEVEKGPFPTLNVLDRGPPAQTTHAHESLGHIRWLCVRKAKGMTHTDANSHDHKHVMKRLDFERLVLDRGCRSSGFGMHGLTKRLLNRVFSSDERQYVLGKFLLPTAIRYDGQSKSPSELDKPSLFFNFPYLSLEHHHCWNCDRCKAGAPDDHPMRSLFQFRYRLQRTRMKDKAQVASVDPTIISGCLPPSVRVPFARQCEREAPLIHVPQLWIAMISEVEQLARDPCEGKRCKSRGQRSNTEQNTRQYLLLSESFSTILLQPSISPIQASNVVGGFCNKVDADERKDQSQGGTNTEKRASKVNFKPLTAQEYIFCRHETPQTDNHIDIHNWRDILTEAGKQGIERLDIWLRKGAPGLSITPADAATTSTAAPIATPAVAATNNPQAQNLSTPAQSNASAFSTSSNAPASSINSQVPGSQTQTSLSASGTSAPGNSTPPKERNPRGHSFDRVPFFYWPIIDDFRKPSEISDVKRAIALLNMTYEDFCKRHEKLLSPQTHGKLAVSSSNADITHYSYAAIFEFLETRKHSQSPDNLKTLFEFRERCQSLIHFYIPVEADDASAPLSHSATKIDPDAVVLYWSLVRAIVQVAVNDATKIPSLSATILHIKEIQRLAQELHLGTELAFSADARPSTYFLPNRVVLETIVLSLVQVFDLLATTLVKLSTPSDDGLSVADVASAAQRSLADAKAQLIVEADDMIPEKGLGSVVTSEAIVIMLLQRLSAGVYNEEKIEILELYERTVEDIALKLDSEQGASRRLLLKINSLVEELDIVHEVLRQQSAILKMFRWALDPASFDRRSVNRRISFEDESKCIDRIIQEVKGRTLECEELKERAERLAEQNVQLVETQQDDNSKAIMVFTIVTVLFLPPSFISSYFGMNLKGIGNTDSGPRRFWCIAAPLTAGVTLLCVLLVYFTPIKREWKKGRDVRKEGGT